jgi:hypothetical protein
MEIGGWGEEEEILPREKECREGNTPERQQGEGHRQERSPAARVVVARAPLGF